MPRVRSDVILQSKGYYYIKIADPASQPSYVDLRFKDIIPELASIELGDYKLFKHQYETYMSLLGGHNIVLRAGTGSGKTEAWVLYLLHMLKNNRNFYAIAVYPTLALANDQVKRLERYLKLLGKSPVQIDSVRLEEYRKRGERLREMISISNLVITNPAFLLHDLKKHLVKRTTALLASVYNNLDLLVIDELDFYSPRSLALLLAMISVLSKISNSKLQIVVLSAGISNPVDLCEFLKNTTDRDCKIIEGEPFRVENNTYVVLGRDIEKIWRFVLGIWDQVISDHPELSSLTSSVKDYNEFKSKLYKIVSLLQGLGYEVPSIATDPIEIISEYANDDYVTVVFTRSISTAEELAKSIKERFGKNYPVATHHHLVPKRIREEIEEKARSGSLKIIISPRTLSQGMDIGLVARIVHLGLPDNVREFYQREGRKGRRRELGFSETIIIPYSRWDRELLSSGLDTFKEWLSLGLEKTLVNPDNLYIHLFTGVAKLISPWFKEELREREIEALRSAGILSSDGKIREKRLKEIFEKINFYEFAPPYGIKRYIEREGSLMPLEPIGHVDLIEKFQPGCIDYGEESIVVSLEYGKSSRIVRCVLEKPIREIDFRTVDGLSEAIEEYRYIKLKWSETPNLLKDLLSGRITSEELCVVYTPRNGFGRYIKIPERCIWTLRSERPRYMMINGEPIVYYDRRSIYVPMPTGGEYRDFTYGYTYSVDPRENVELIRLALAYIIVLLRRYLGIPLHTILYDAVKLGEFKYFSLHEPEAAGIIEKLDWLKIRKIVDEHRPTDLDRIMISEIDDLAYSTLITIEFNWSLVKEQALRVVDYILARDKIKVTLQGRELAIPRPSPALKIASYVIISEVLDDESLTPSLITAHGFYDGERFVGEVELYPPIPFAKPPSTLLAIENTLLDKIHYEDYKLLIENYDTVLTQLKQANLKRLVSYLESKRTDTIDLSSLLDESRIGIATAEEIASNIGLEMSVSHASILNIFRKIREYKKILEKEKELILRYLEEKAKSIYMSYLLVTTLLMGQDPGSSQETST